MRRGSTADLPAIVSLLQVAGLPTQDLSSISDLRIWMLESGHSLYGVIALQPFGTDGLLRSLAVAPTHRNSGVGRALVAQLERESTSEGVRRLVLLTDTAEGFFRKLGYQNIDRIHVGEAMKRSAEFRSLCPASATCMAKMLLSVESAS